MIDHVQKADLLVKALLVNPQRFGLSHGLPAQLRQLLEDVRRELEMAEEQNVFLPEDDLEASLSQDADHLCRTA